ncbi:hypothetical protein [Cytobacillus sp. IB215665]|uniref:hypothetical protein n=1 Tax=Cytobacillus sp. IB215665 TaxID=3097357 RepID=UPI002A141B70|nr:hypothetical protein [Cytobacillus sp. IB215665]MDX8367777.1 hypothetical protein [Cytobacillus sp. IB215665]
MNIICRWPIQKGKEIVPVGEPIDLPVNEAERLIKKGLAEEVRTIPLLEGSHTTELADEVDQENISEDSDYIEITEQEYQELHQALYQAFNKDPLITAAKAVGVELSEEDVKKKDSVIEQIITQDKVDEVLATKEVD